MKTIFLFVRRNMISFLGMTLGLIGGYLYWLYYGIYDGTFGFSSELWTNCVYGLLFGGLIGSLIRKKTINHYEKKNNFDHKSDTGHG